MLLKLRAAEINHTLITMKTLTLEITNVINADVYGEPSLKCIHKNAYLI